MPRVQLDIARREKAENLDPLEFEINGEVYGCQDDMSEFVIMELAATADSSDPQVVGTAFMGFLADVLALDDTPGALYEDGRTRWGLARFKEQARREKWDVDQLLPMVQEAVEYYSARPTGPRSSSGIGGETTSTQSKVVNLSTGEVAVTD